MDKETEKFIIKLSEGLQIQKEINEKVLEGLSSLDKRIKEIEK